ncbi:MAG: FIG01050400: hypothetical protein, partial [uncultured Corynebacteriales bacterium]
DHAAESGARHGRRGAHRRPARPRPPARAGRLRAVLALRAEEQAHGGAGQRHPGPGAVRQDLDPVPGPEEIPGLPGVQGDLGAAAARRRRRRRPGPL